MKKMIKPYKYFLTLIFGMAVLSANVKASTFIDGLEDVPIMKGFTQIQNDNISFGNEESRFVEAYLTGSKVGFKAVEKFYTGTLPQLGWTYQGKRGNTLVFYREKESLEIVPEKIKPLIVRITVKNRV